MKIAINGLGRIGKSFLRALMLDQDARKYLDIVAINIGPAQLEHVGLLFTYDTIMGKYPGSVEQKGSVLTIDGHKIALLQKLDPKDLAWKTLRVDWVVDCSGKFTHADKAKTHLESGAQAVLISAPAKGEDVAIVPGVNDAMYQHGKHVIVSLGSCTTNAFMPMLKVLQEHCGFQKGFMTTVHAYTNSQVLLDIDGDDPRRARAAALNIIPTTTGAAKMVGKIIPSLQGKIEACALRVPVGIVSYITISFVADRSLTKEAIHTAFKQACKKELKGIVDISYEPLVSSDFSGNSYSVVIDAGMTSVTENLVSVSGWYDNEWAYSQRLKDFLVHVAKQ